MTTRRFESISGLLSAFQARVSLPYAINNNINEDEENGIHYYLIEDL